MKASGVILFSTFSKHITTQRQHFAMPVQHSLTAKGKKDGQPGGSGTATGNNESTSGKTSANKKGTAKSNSTTSAHGIKKDSSRVRSDKTGSSSAGKSESKRFDCLACEQPNTADNMVACDRCHSWYHFRCAGVNAKVAEQLWLCEDCRPNVTAAAKKKLRKRIQTNGGKDKVRLTLVSEHSNSANDQGGENDGDDGDIDDSASTSSSSDGEAEDNSDDESVLLLEIDNKLKLLDRTRKRLARKRQKLLDRTDSDSDADPLLIDTDVHHQRRRSGPAASSTMHRSATLTKQQIAARQSLNTNLPTFSGKPGEWPVFRSNFDESTEACNFSNADNLMRLQKALVGTARKFVEPLLTLPSCVPKIMKTLEDTVGRPEYILEDRLADLRTAPAPRAGKLDTIVSYALAVQNFVATLQAARLRDHLNSPVLLKELVGKLPASQKLEWINYRRTVRKAGTVEFASWLHNLSMDICSVMRVKLDDEPSSKSKERNKPFVGAHMEDTRQ